MSYHVFDLFLIDRGSIPLSGETKSKMSASKQGQGNPNKGKSFSDEHKAKLSASHKGMKHSDETKAKMSAKKANPVYLYAVHLHGLELVSTHHNVSRLAEFLGVLRTILDYARDIRNQTLFQINGVSYIASMDPNLT